MAGGGANTAVSNSTRDCQRVAGWGHQTVSYILELCLELSDLVFCCIRWANAEATFLPEKEAKTLSLCCW